MSENTLIGKRIPRIGSVDKVLGRARYTGDLVKPNMLSGYSAEDQTVDPTLWLDEARARLWEFRQSYAPMPSYDQTLFVLRAESRGGETDFLGDIEDTEDRLH